MAVLVNSTYHSNLGFGKGSLDIKSRQALIDRMHQMPKSLERHESRAGSVFTLLIGCMVIAQLLLVYWRKRHYRSYQQVTLVGLWLIPFLFATSMHFYKLMFLHSLWTIWYDPTVCLLCGDPLNYNWALMHSRIQSQDIASATTAERTVSLGCGHAFHDFCVRGWTLVGKRETCPYCGEKVSLRAMLANPWETQSLMWSNLLDLIRYLIVWNPVMIAFAQLLLRVAAALPS